MKLNEEEMECWLRGTAFFQMNLHFKGCESILRKKKWKMSINHATGSRFRDWIEFRSSLPIFSSYMATTAPDSYPRLWKLSPPLWSAPVTVLSTLPENGHKHIKHFCLSHSFTHAHASWRPASTQNVRRNCAVNNFLSVPSSLSTLAHCHLPTNNPQAAMVRLWVINSYFFKQNKYGEIAVSGLESMYKRLGHLISINYITINNSFVFWFCTLICFSLIKRRYGKF